MNTIVLIDDETLDVMAVVKTDMNSEEIKKVIHEVKTAKPGEWSNTDIVEAIGGTEIECNYFYI